MTMGERIKELRESKNMSMGDLSKLLGLQRQAIMKYEHGIVENIPRKTIMKMSAIFGVSPCYLMCFDEHDEKQISEEVQVIEQIQKVFGKDSVKLLQYFHELNETGKEKALEDLADLTELKKYTKEVQGE